MSEPFDPRSLPGITFRSRGKTMRYIYPTDHWLGGWIVVQNRSGYWMTLRRATDQDVTALSEAVVKAHHGK